MSYKWKIIAIFVFDLELFAIGRGVNFCEFWVGGRKGVEMFFYVFFLILSNCPFIRKGKRIRKKVHKI